MSLASLAVYSSSSGEESDSEDTPSAAISNSSTQQHTVLTSECSRKSTTTTTTTSSSLPSSEAPPAQKPAPNAVQLAPSAVDLIEDEDGDGVTSGSVTSSLPRSEQEEPAAGSVFQADDVVDDVPLADQLHAEKPKKSGKVRIAIPSLAQFRDEDGEPTAKKPKQTSKGSGLFALLPPPKSQSVKQQGRILLPQSVSRPPAVKRPSATAASLSRSGGVNSVSAASLVSAPDSDGEDEPASGADFFSLSEPERTPVPLPAAAVAGPLTYSERLQAEQDSEQWSMYQQAAAAEVPQTVAMETDAYDDEARQKEADARLEAQALEQLGGRRGRGRQEQDIQLVDVCQDELVASRQEWMMKALTEEAVVRRPQKSSDDPTNQQRRKHQITYLAHQAKEREVELKNDWAQNRANRNAYRSRYGF